MRACFLGQNICTLGYGVATLQMPPLAQEPRLVMDSPVKGQGEPKEGASVHLPEPVVEVPPAVTNSPRLCA